jgi:hypothetical protein
MEARRRAVADVSSVRRERAGDAGEIRSLLWWGFEGNEVCRWALREMWPNK